jgi:very-short-patch-repair endonuclease
VGPRSGTVEQQLARIATRQHGVVTRGQLLDAGLSRENIRSRVRNGALLREHRGVYRVGHRAPNLEALYLAAVLACGKDARLSGLAAAHLYELHKGRIPAPEVIAPTKRRIPGVRTHRARVADFDTAVWRGIRVTTVARTLVDLAAILAEDALARACHEAGIRFRTTPTEVEDVLGRRPSSPGARKLRRVLHGDVRVTLSVLERRFLDVLEDAGLPLPQTNTVAGGRRVDCRWAAARLTVELDGYRFHSSRHAWEQDREREREARARGDEFRRFTYGDVTESPGAMLRDLRALLLADGHPRWGLSDTT